MRYLRQLLSFLLLLALVMTSASCAIREEDATEIAFSDKLFYDELAELDGQPVVLCGYMAINAPSGGRHFYLMNTPHATFSPGMTVDEALLSRIEVYPRGGTVAYFGDHAVKVVGRLSVAPHGTPFTDSDGYMAYWRIEQATYAPLPVQEMNNQQLAWEQLAGYNYINTLIDALNYTHFCIGWNEYETPVSGAIRYLLPEEALVSLTERTGQFYYGTSDGYFTRLRETVESVDVNQTELLSMLNEMERLSREGLASLRGDNYTAVPLSPEEIVKGYTGQKYVPNDSEELLADYEALYKRYEAWLRSFAF